MKLTIAVALIGLVAAPCVAQTATGDIEKARLQFAEFVNEGDAASLAGMFTERAIVLPPDADIVAGREAIEKYWRGVFAAGLKHVSQRSLRIDAYGSDAAREIGRFHLDAPASGEALEGKYLFVWRKQGKDWLLDSSIWNFTRPADQ